MTETVPTTASPAQVLTDYMLWQKSGATGPVPHRYVAKEKSRRTSTATSIGPIKLKVPATAIPLPHGGVYVPRMWGDHADVEVLREARRRAWNEDGTIGADYFVSTYGPPGTGKTAIMYAAFGTDVVIQQFSGETEVADLLGGWVQLADGSIAWRDGSLVKAMEEGKVWFADEIAIGDPKVLTVAYSAMDGRREVESPNPDRGMVRAKPGFFIVSAYNPDAPGARVSEALMSRFRIHVHLTTDYPLARKLGVDSRLVTAAHNLDRKREAGAVMWSPQLRELLAFRDNSIAFGFDFAMSNLMSTCPEDDRAEFSSILERTFGRKYEHLRAGEQFKPSTDTEVEDDESRPDLDAIASDWSTKAEDE